MPYDELMFGESQIFQVITAQKKDGKVLIYVNSKQPGSNCPECNDLSSRIHSYYTRKIMDLPMVGSQTWLILNARKFYCLNVSCIRKVFAERFPEHIVTRKTVTKRVNEKLLKIASLMGGNGGVRICQLMNLPTSSSTLIRLIHQQPIEQNTVPKVLGIDDWAFKKGSRYGTIIVDLEKRKIIDLLPDRETLSVEQWLKAHPGVEIVSRDRYGNFANGVKNASPTIKHVADRWHLLKNLGDAMQKALDRNVVSLKAARHRKNIQAHNEIQPLPGVGKEGEIIEKGVIAKKFYLVKQMLLEGNGIKKIARDTGVTRITIRKWKSFDVLPPKRSPKMTNMHLYDEAVRKMLVENPNIETKEILKKIKEMGYNGSVTICYENVRKLRERKTKKTEHQLSTVFWVPPKASNLFYLDRRRLSKSEKMFIDTLCAESKEIKRAATLIRQFKNMLKKKEGSMLNAWINNAIASNVKEIKGFAKGLLSDFEAIENGVKLPWSNGPVEGLVNKLKIIKRQMYGRASFELLRKRLVNHQS
jgi:transposase